ncbi:MAG: hypothetical protein ACRDSL_23200 [Pseudonocardiaceae bacterium]
MYFRVRAREPWRAAGGNALNALNDLAHGNARPCRTSGPARPPVVSVARWAA